jgi:glutathione S-transferase
MALTLYSDGFYISPYVFSVFIALEEKGVPYQLTTVALQERAHDLPEYRDRAITGRVPAIDHDGFWLAESAAIDNYLDDAFPFPQYQRALPEGIKERARARMVLDWIRSDLMPIREERPTHTMFYQRAQQPLSAAGELARKRLIEIALRLVPEGSPSLFSSWSIADSDLAFMLQRLILNGHDVPARLRSFVDVQWARPSVRKWLALPRVPYVPY